MQGYKHHMRDKWNATAAGWHKWMPMMREWSRPATDLMLDLARIGPGSRVLDIAAGDGDQSLAVAGRVGSSGYVLATDLAEELLELAELSAREAGFQNFETRVMDGENLDLPVTSFDAVICRFGLTFFSDPDRALSEMNRVLKPGGRVSVVIYAASGSPELSLAYDIVRRRTRQPAPSEQPSGSGLGAPGVLEQKLHTAGFHDVETQTLSLPLRLASAAECTRYLRDASPTLREMLAPLTPQARQEIWLEIEEALSTFERPEGFEALDEVLVAAGSATQP